MENNVKRTVCASNMCCGCMACLETCHKNAINMVDTLGAFNAVKNNNCIDCGLCEKVCPQNNTVELKEPIYWGQGWTTKDENRASSASGGYAMELARSFIRDGGVVCCCRFDKGEFSFDFAYTEKSLYRFAGSKYVKSNPRGVYSKIKRLLKDSTKVLFIGLPCQVAAVKNFVGGKFLDGLYTVDLICHGTPSSSVLELFLSQYKLKLTDLSDIQFRTKMIYQNYYSGYKGFAPQGTDDYYTLSFLHGLSYTENCYNCKYAQRKRVSDITIGDSWGASFQNNELFKGVSLALVQTERGKDLLQRANVVIKDVDLDFAISNNKQLCHPSTKPSTRDSFLSMLKDGRSFNSAVFKSIKKTCIRQWIKFVFIKIGIKKVVGINYRIIYK